MMLRKMTMMSVLLAMTVSVSGCFWLVAGGAAAGGAAYVMGEMKVVEEVTLDKAVSASEDAIEDLEMTVRTSTKDAINGQVKSRTADNKEVIIKLRRQTDNTTEIKIRVGPFGDQAMSQMILDKIRENM